MKGVETWDTANTSQGAHTSPVTRVQTFFVVVERIQEEYMNEVVAAWREPRTPLRRLR